MTDSRYVVLSRNLTSNGIEVAGIWYQSSALQGLRGDVEEMAISIKLDPLDVTGIQARDAGSEAWISVPFLRFERLASEREIDEIARDLYAAAHRAATPTPDELASAHIGASSRLGWQVEKAPRDPVSRGKMPVTRLLWTHVAALFRHCSRIVLHHVIDMESNR